MSPGEAIWFRLEIPLPQRCTSLLALCLVLPPGLDICHPDLVSAIASSVTEASLRL